MTEATCPHCGEPVERRQLVCLNCGGRVALRGRGGWAREPAAALAAVLAVLIVIGAGLFGFALSELTSGDGDGDSGRGEHAAKPAATTERPAVGGQGQDERSTTETTPAAEPAAAPRADRVPGWPAGTTAHTVVLVTSSDRAAALNVAKEARARGLEAGLIRSDPYDLGSGLWIVYSGRFTTREGAQRQAAQLAERYPGAYPQLVQRSQ